MANQDKNPANVELDQASLQCAHCGVRSLKVQYALGTTEATVMQCGSCESVILVIPKASGLA